MLEPAEKGIESSTKALLEKKNLVLQFVKLHKDYVVKAS